MIDRIINVCGIVCISAVTIAVMAGAFAIVRWVFFGVGP